jgi:hypothetical protein
MLLPPRFVALPPFSRQRPTRPGQISPALAAFIDAIQLSAKAGKSR